VSSETLTPAPSAPVIVPPSLSIVTSAPLTAALNTSVIWTPSLPTPPPVIVPPLLSMEIPPSTSSPRTAQELAFQVKFSFVLRRLSQSPNMRAAVQSWFHFSHRRILFARCRHLSSRDESQELYTRDPRPLRTNP
jgi:hypothetical protein